MYALSHFLSFKKKKKRLVSMLLPKVDRNFQNCDSKKTLRDIITNLAENKCVKSATFLLSSTYVKRKQCNSENFRFMMDLLILECPENDLQIFGKF